MNEIRATSIFNVFEIKLFQTKTLQRESQNYFRPELSPREASVDKCCNFVTFSGKTDWLRPFLLMHWSCRPHFYLGKGGFHR